MCVIWEVAECASVNRNCAFNMIGVELHFFEAIDRTFVPRPYLSKGGAWVYDYIILVWEDKPKPFYVSIVT